jgi:hypothetical protein
VRRLRRRVAALPPADRVAWAGVLVAAIAAAALIALHDPPESSAPTRPASPVPTEPADGAQPVTVDAESALVLGGTAVRALRAARSDGAIIVTLRVRNGTGRPQRVGAGGFSLALEVGGARVAPAALAAAPLPEGETATLRPRFRVGPGAAPPREVLLHVTPWREAGAPAAGAIRLEVTGG